MSKIDFIERKKKPVRREDKKMPGKTAAVVGGGASGLMASIAAARNGAPRVFVLEGNMEAGEKIKATGNGRCNLMNSNVEAGRLNSSDSDLPNVVYESFDYGMTRKFFDGIGVMIREEDEGRCYPASGQASSVREALIREAEREGVVIITGAKVTGITGGFETGFTISIEDEEPVFADAVIIATGGRAGLQYGSTGDGYGFAKSFGHTLTAPRPALVPLVSEEKYFKEIKGVRAKAEAALFSGDTLLAKDRGEVQFTPYGLSGICIFNLSRYVRRELNDMTVSLDFFPDMTEEELLDFLSRQEKRQGDIGGALFGLVNEKLVPVLIEAGARDAGSASRILKSFAIPVSGTKGWKEAQTTCGGITPSEVDHVTLESKLAPGIFFAGEVLDVDGLCGGYNLQWAWSSGYTAGRACGLKLKK